MSPTGVLDWLLEADDANPGARYFALTDLLDRPEDAPDVRAARQAVMATGPVPTILAAQSADGSWVQAGSGYKPKYRGTTWQLLFLAELGADPADERVRWAAEYVLDHSRAATGAFSVYDPPAPHGSYHCLNGNLDWALVRLGWGADPRVQEALGWEARAITGEAPVAYHKSGTSGPGFECGVNYNQPCGWGANKAMRALLEVPVAERTPLHQRAIEMGAEFLLGRDPAVADYPYSERVSSTWFKFGFPLTYWSDVLETAAVLVDAGFGGDERLTHVLDLVESKRDNDGRWKLENALTGKMWSDIEARGKPSKWITLRALRVLKRAGRMAPSV